MLVLLGSCYKGGSAVAWRLRQGTCSYMRMNVDFPEWMLDSLDEEAARIGVTRQSIIKVWLAERLEQIKRTYR